MKKLGVNQQLIADQLNLSRTTVSRCFTNHPGINPETRSRVFRLATSLSYSYREGKTGKKSERKSLSRLGVLMCTDTESYADEDYENPGARLLTGVSEYAQLSQAKLDVHYVSPEDRSLTSPSYREIDALQNREWDGAILIYPFPRAVTESLQKLFPLVSFVEQYSAEPLNSVDVNHHRGISLALEHLYNKGHRRIGFLTHAYDVRAKWTLRRFSAFIEESTRLELEIHPDDIIDPVLASKLSIEAIHEKTLTQTRDGVTAWICAADHQGYQLIAHLREAGLSIPDDVSVTGFDGIKPPQWAPQLTTVSIPYHEIGLTGGKRLDDLVKKRFGSPQDILIDCRLSDGETTSICNQKTN